MEGEYGDLWGWKDGGGEGGVVREAWRGRRRVVRGVISHCELIML